MNLNPTRWVKSLWRNHAEPNTKVAASRTAPTTNHPSASSSQISHQNIAPIDHEPSAYVNLRDEAVLLLNNIDAGLDWADRIQGQIDSQELLRIQLDVYGKGSVMMTNLCNEFMAFANSGQVANLNGNYAEFITLWGKCVEKLTNLLSEMYNHTQTITEFQTGFDLDPKYNFIPGAAKNELPQALKWEIDPEIFDYPAEVLGDFLTRIIQAGDAAAPETAMLSATLRDNLIKLLLATEHLDNNSQIPQDIKARIDQYIKTTLYLPMAHNTPPEIRDRDYPYVDHRVKIRRTATTTAHPLTRRIEEQKRMEDHKRMTGEYPITPTPNTES